MFCLAEGRALAPVAEQQLVAYVGWQAQEREAGRRSVSAGSLPQYLTAARTVASSLFGGDTATTTIPLLSALQRAYARWKAENIRVCPIAAACRPILFRLFGRTSSSRRHEPLFATALP
jgi:hypothetical protein